MKIQALEEKVVVMLFYLSRFQNRQGNQSIKQTILNGFWIKKKKSKNTTSDIHNYIHVHI